MPETRLVRSTMRSSSRGSGGFAVERFANPRAINPQGSRVGEWRIRHRSRARATRRYTRERAEGAKGRDTIVARASRIRGHLIARLTRTTPETIRRGGYHRRALSRPIRHARRLTTCRNRASSLSSPSLYQFSAYTPGEREGDGGHKGRRASERARRGEGDELCKRGSRGQFLSRAGLAARCRWNEASGVLDRWRRRSTAVPGLKIAIINRR